MDNATLETEWRKFALACFGDIGHQQYTDLRRTFYAGASALFFLFMKVLDPGVEPTEADLAKVTVLHAEINNFNEEVKAGRA